jgi:hypothetical protein
MVAVKLRDCPYTVDVGLTVNAVVVFAWLTAWLATAEVLPLKFPSPP